MAALPLAAEEPLWEWVTPRPQGHDLFAAAAGNGLTVAVGRNGTVISSSDGVEWRIRQTGADYDLMDVVWANGVFVAVGGELGFEFYPDFGVVLTSSDGKNWVERYRAQSVTLFSVVWTGSHFVAVGVGNRVVVSDDGLSWTEQPLESTVGMRDLAWDCSKLVAVGRDSGFVGPSSFFVSEDADSWQVQEFDCEYCQPESIAAVGGRFVAIGAWRKALVSDSGLVWNEAPYDASESFDRVVASDTQFVATGYDMVGISPDGYVWSIEDLPIESSVNGLAWLGDGYLAVGEDGFLMSSADGSEWTQLSTSAFGSRGSQEIDEMATNGSTIVGVGAGIITGRHGTEWTWRPSPDDVGPRAVIWTGSDFWAAGENGVVKSRDGVFWTQVLVDHEIRLYDLVWNGSVFVAVGWNPSSGDGRQLILTSPDGDSWSYQWFEQDDHFFSVGWTGSLFVVAGSGPLYFTSSDGVVWQQHPQLLGVTMSDMAWDGHRLIAVGSRLEHGGAIYSTSDGLQWVESSLPEAPESEFRDVTWTGTHFVAVARTEDPSVFVSEDGFSWSVESTDTGVWPVSVVGDATSLYVTGRGLQIIRRTEPLADREPPRRPGRRVAPVGVKVRMGPALPNS